MKNLPDFFRRGTSDVGGNSYRELQSLQRQMDRMLNDLWNANTIDTTTFTLGTPAFTPSCDVDETDSLYLMSFDLPGVKKDDIKIDFKDGVLTVSGERKSETEKKEKTSYRSERFYGSFSRSFQLPTGVKPEQVETYYADGVLRIAVPKTETVKTQQIKVGEGKTGFWDKILGHKKEDSKVITPASNASQEKRPSEKVA